jgi:hypothetical protein
MPVDQPVGVLMVLVVLAPTIATSRSPATGVASKVAETLVVRYPPPDFFWTSAGSGDADAERYRPVWMSRALRAVAAAASRTTARATWTVLVRVKPPHTRIQRRPQAEEQSTETNRAGRSLAGLPRS